jgi:hypothetical protein
MRQGTHLDVSDDHRVAIGVQKVFTFGVPAQN